MEQKISSSYLHSLAGRVVRIYKGGPESRIGYLMDIQEDHLVLFNDEDGFLYYNINHIKSVCDSPQDEFKANLLQKAAKNDKDKLNPPPQIQAKSFWDVLKTMEQHTVRINRGGHHSKVGRLVSVKSDYAMLETEKEGLLYYYIHHIKSISWFTQQEKQTLETMPADDKTDTHEQTSYSKAESFENLLQELQYRWIRINGEGPESIEGVLSASSASDLTIVANQDVYRIPLFHIRMISQKIAQVNNDGGENKEQSNSTAKSSSTNAGKENSTKQQAASTKQNNKKEDGKKQEKEADKKQAGNKKENNRAKQKVEKNRE
ncbi:hypothetical protein DFP93_11941 [Aneurinibacillus soli]|uniref:Uncharacterized protein n=1 Tax=Aneurinibacillus soli TaxID=1500254 RepID=A0A0U5B0M3_9BACL|nr:hypothetical protein [Aneurinibacillus soli]PYE59117.1 hypothetical protein DFP93_11941 [Aneurinibacillus soli]BAU29537.1 hypothetical protein CB4_03737 [Aneurinibacillus soli]